MTKILVIDDEKSIRDLCAHELAQEGYDVATTGVCDNIQEVISAIRPCVLVLDIRMEECDTLELLAEIRQGHKTLPVILYTAYDSYRDDPRYAAADDYVVKSYDLTRLKEAIAKVVAPSGKVSNARGASKHPAVRPIPRQSHQQKSSN